MITYPKVKYLPKESIFGFKVSTTGLATSTSIK